MRCEQARQLFDAYLDGELPPALATELGAHRVQCAECRQALALLEVTGHILASDTDPVSIGDGFPDRLLACMETPQQPRAQRIRRALYVGGPLAAAAVITLALVGVFDPGNGEVAGDSFTASKPVIIVDDQNATAQPYEAPASDGDLPAVRALEDWIEQTRMNVAAKRESGESLQKALDLTVRQWLDILDEAKDTSSGEDHFPGAAVSDSPDARETIPAEIENVEEQ